MRKLLTVLLALTLVFGSVISASAATTGFSDVKTSDWFYKYVYMSDDMGSVGGYPDGTFLPNGTVTYAELSKMTCETFGFPITTEGGQWYQKYLDAQAKLNVGLPSTDPNKKLTRNEVASYIVSYLDQFMTYDQSKAVKFADVYDEGNDATDELSALGIMIGTNGSDGKVYFNGDSPVTRAEICKILAMTNYKVRLAWADYDVNMDSVIHFVPSAYAPQQSEYKEYCTDESYNPDTYYPGKHMGDVN